ncbi:MAG: N-ethylammeline chlorohydrolase [Candidatus Wolframiiraptor sp. EX4484-121]|nr:MAG: N-ethylammeline chlorohydrolase [Candidatus Wolframiiraptor sp. EX4484-121]
MRRFELAIRNGIILTMDNRMRVFRPGSIGIDDGVIEYVGPEDVRGETEIDASRCVVIPGLVNCHTHAAMTLFRNAVEDQPLEKWLKEYVWPVEERLKPEHVRVGTRAACAEMALAGITCFNDQYFYMDQVAEAAVEVGIRGVLCEGMIEGFDEEKGRKALKRGVSFAEKYNGWRGMIWTRLGPHAEYSCSLEFLRNVREEADRLGVGIHIHLAETKAPVEEFVEKHGRSPVKVLDEMGFFKDDVIIAHAIYLDDEDLKILSERNVAVAYNPVSNMKLASGIARVVEMLRLGIRVGIGTDGPGSNNSLDLLQDIKIGTLLQKTRYMDPTVLPAKQALWMATRGGAEALNLSKLIGSIEVGKRADIAVIDTRRIRYIPVRDPYTAITYCSSGSDVRDVIVDGKIIVRGGELQTMDPQKIVEDLEGAVQELFAE